MSVVVFGHCRVMNFSCDWQHFEPNEAKMKEINERINTSKKEKRI